MSELRKILGTSVLSLFLVVWGLFMVCSGRVPEVNYDDYSMLEDENSGEGDLMEQLAMLDDETSKLDNSHRQEILAALGIDPNDTGVASSESDAALTEELFLDLEVQIAELEKMSQNKSDTLDSLRLELQEADHQIAALSTVVNTPEPQFASTEAIPTPAKPRVSTNGASNGHTKNTATNGHSNGSTNGHTNGYTNGSTNSYTNGSTNGHGNSSANGYAQVTSDIKGLYQEALDAVYARKFETAIARFSDLLMIDASGDLADNSQYWIGECYYAIGNYEQALAEFEKVFAFDRNNKADDAQFMMGMTYLKLGETELAEIEFNGLLNFYSNSEYVMRAEKKLDDLSI